MLISYDPYDWLMIKDIERCPYTSKDDGYLTWHNNDDQRLELIALDRYADFLQDKLKKEDTPTGFNIREKYKS